MEKIATYRTPVLITIGLATLFGVALLVPRHRDPAQPQPRPPAPGGARAIDLVIALDTSSSMDGLIDGARQQIWETVSQLGKAQPRPALRVGLISYGNTSYDASAGWVRLDSDLSTDLDGIYGKLFGLRTGGGEEYVARALHTAVTGMNWSKEPGVRRIFIVAGNEPADQDPQIPLPRALDEARGLGISVNTIYCGSESNGEVALWRDLARKGEGKFAAIDQSAAVVVATPVDSELARLSGVLNSTYVPYGAAGAPKAMNQAAQDTNANSLGLAAAAGRAVAKSSALYKNTDWDLVDAAKDGKLAAIPESDLPDDLRKMNPADRQAFLKKKGEERAAIQQKIDALSAQRAGHLKAAKARRAPGKKDFGEALTEELE